MEPMKLMLTASGTKRLKQKRDKLLSTLALNFNLRRYGKAVLFKKFAGIDAVDLEIDEKDPVKLAAIVRALGRAVHVATG